MDDGFGAENFAALDPRLQPLIHRRYMFWSHADGDGAQMTFSRVRGLDGAAALVDRQPQSRGGAVTANRSQHVHLRSAEKSRDDAVARPGVEFDRRSHLLDDPVTQDN